MSPATPPAGPATTSSLGAGPFKDARWAAWRAFVQAVARHAGQRTACPFAARRGAGPACAREPGHLCTDTPWSAPRSKTTAARDARPTTSKPRCAASGLAAGVLFVGSGSTTGDRPGQARGIVWRGVAGVQARTMRPHGLARGQPCVGPLPAQARARRNPEHLALPK